MMMAKLLYTGAVMTLILKLLLISAAGAIHLPTDADPGYFATSNGQIVNAEGTPVRLVGISW
jgi:hypothetical protein